MVCGCLSIILETRGMTNYSRNYITNDLKLWGRVTHIELGIVNWFTNKFWQELIHVYWPKGTPSGDLKHLIKSLLQLTSCLLAKIESDKVILLNVNEGSPFQAGIYLSKSFPPFKHESWECSSLISNLNMFLWCFLQL